MVFGEIREGELRNVAFEAIAAAKQVADGGEVAGVLLGANVHHLANDLIYYGADRVITVENIQLQSYTPDAYSQALLQVIEAEKTVHSFSDIPRLEKMFHQGSRQN